MIIVILFFFWIIKYIRTLLQYEYKRKTIFQHSIFLQWQNFFLALPLFLHKKIWSVQQSPAFKQSEWIEISKTTDFHINDMIYKQKWIQGSFKVLLKFAPFEKTHWRRTTLKIQFQKFTMSSKNEEFGQISANCKLHYIEDHTFWISPIQSSLI